METSIKILNLNPAGVKGFAIPEIGELPDDEAILVAIAGLEKLGNLDVPIVYGAYGDHTVNELIKALRNKEPLGLEMLELWRNAEIRMKQCREELEEKPTFVERLKTGFSDALKKMF